MVRMKWFLVGGGLAGSVVLAAYAFSQAQPPASPNPGVADRSKYTVEAGTKNVVAPAQPAPAVNFKDLSKVAIELPTKAVLGGGAPAKGAGNFVNPKVQPGLVRWHKDLTAACAAAARSGKPVLLFQMMGKLDDQFC